VSVPVLAAVTGASWEAALVAGLERTPSGITVVRRCVDLADLLAAASTGTARGALLSADLRRLDRDALARLAAARVAVVGLYAPGDEQAETRLRQLGVVHLLPADAPPSDIAAAVSAAMADQEAGAVAGTAWSQPLEALPVDAAPVDALPAIEPGSGRLVAVWGPTGAPGRTTVAVTVAAELAASGVPTLLADADVYGGVVAQVLGFLDEAPGLAAAARLANNGQLDASALAAAAPQAAPNLRVLTGISRADRWPELRPSALDQVWALARSLAAVTVVDLGFCLEQDEELSFDTAAPRRNGATLATLGSADTVLAVGAADPVGMQRLLRGLTQLNEAVPGALPRVVVNRVRRGAVGSDPEAQIAEALDRYAGIRDVAFVPEDREGLDAALLQARVLGEVSPDSRARLALAAIAAGLVGRAAPKRRRGLLRRGA
jgi:MinD-like ATPase involved in chromosome partitioning or flagellar assembly